jgi:hypothetical protein
MESKSGSKNINWLLFVVPCFFLLGFGYLLQIKRETKFALITEKVFLSPLTAQEQRRGFDTKVTIVMNTRGPWPDWLTAPSPPNGPVRGWSTDPSIFYMKNGQKLKFTWPKGVKSSGVSGTRYDKSQQRFIAHGLLNLSAVPKSLGKLTCDFQVDLAHVSLPPNRKWSIISSAKGSIVVRP